MSRGPAAGRAVASIWLIGMPIFLMIGRWYDGLFFLIGLASIIQGILDGQILRGVQIGCWSLGFVCLMWLPETDLALMMFSAGSLLLLFAAIRSLAYGTPVTPKPARDDLLE